MAERIPVKAIYSGTYGSSDVTSLGELASGETINGSYITDDTIDEANLKISNSPTNGHVLTAQSGASGGLTWAADSTTDSTKLPLAGGTMTGDLVLDEITETEATSAATTYTVDLANGTIFDLTSGSTCTVTMPSAEAGKSFTVIAAVPAAWSGTIKWSGGAAPTTGSGITIYSFISDGSNWYGMQAGTGFA